MIFSVDMFFYCMLAGAAFLLLVDLALAPVERALKRAGLWGDFPQSLLKSKRAVNLNDFIVQLALYVALPTALYAWMYLMLPLEGARQGVAIALWTVLIGGAPVAVTLATRARLPAAALVFALLTNLVKLAGALAIIGFIFAL